MLGNVVEDEVSTDITSNYNGNVAQYHGLGKKAKLAHSKTNTFSKYNSCLVPEDPSGTQAARLQYIHVKTVGSKDRQETVTAGPSFRALLDLSSSPQMSNPPSSLDLQRPAPSGVGADSPDILRLSWYI